MTFELKLTPFHWSGEYGIRIVDPDGWRLANSPSMDTPITRKEWEKRMSISTIEVLDELRFDAYRRP